MADLQPTDVLLVNRGGVDYSIPQSDVMADVLDTDLLLVNRAGVDYQATYADVKKGFGPQHINPAPGDWAFNPAIVSGTGTQADPFIITPETVNAPGGTVQSAQTLTLTGLTPNDLVEWTDHSTGTGNRFHQLLGLVPPSGQVDLRLNYLDTPNSTVGAPYTGDLQIGTSYFRWVVTQNVAVAPVIDTVVLADSPEAGRFSSSSFATTATMTDDGTPASTKGLKAWVEGTLKSAAQTSAITNVGSTNYAAGVTYLTGPETSKPSSNAFDGNPATSVNDNTPSGTTHPGAFNEVHFDFNASPLVSTTGNVEVRLQSNPTNPNPGAVFTVHIAVNGGAYVPATDFYATSGGADNEGWQDLGVQTLTSLSVKSVYGGLNAAGTPIFGFRINGTTLVTEKNVLTLTDTTGLADFAGGDAITEVGNGDDATGTVSTVDVTANTITLSASAGTWDVGSQVKGPLKTVNKQPNSDVITAVNSTTVNTRMFLWNGVTWNGSALTGTLPTGLADVLANGVPVTGNSANASATQSLIIVPFGDESGACFSGDGTIRYALDTPAGHYDASGNSLGGRGNYSAGDFSSFNWGTSYAADYVINKAAAYIVMLNRGAAGASSSAGTYPTLSPKSATYTQLTFATDKELKDFASGDAVNQDDSAASGTVASTDATAKTMTLATSTGTWSANTGNYVIGPTKPSSSVKLYTVHDAAGAVSDLQSADPGYVTMTGNSPYTLTFPAVFPTGNAPDVDLPAGTTLTTEVQATSTGSTPVVKTSNTIVPS